jgi:hypothetical protein
VAVAKLSGDGDAPPGCSSEVPIASTGTSRSTVAAFGIVPGPREATAITSTWSPGWIRFATPRTRSIEIEMARIPRGRCVTRAACATATTFDAVTVPPAGIETAAILPTAAAGALRESGSIASPGRMTVVSMSSVICARAGIAFDATTTARGATVALFWRPYDVK